MASCIGLSDVRSLAMWKAALAEFIGTMMLAMVGCGTCLGQRWENVQNPTTVQIALSFGLIVATMVWSIGHVSGGHINPAISVAFFITRRISLIKAIVYVLAQTVGATCGVAILAGLSRKESWGSLGLTSVNSEYVSAAEAFVVEMFITFILVLTVFASCDEQRRDLNGSTPLTIGFAVTVCHLFAIKYTGSSMNPARSFGPAFILMASPVLKDPNEVFVTTPDPRSEYIDGFEHHWIYWLGPIVGGVLAGVIYEVLFAVNASLSRTVAMFTKCPFNRDDYQLAASSGDSDQEMKRNDKV